MLKKHLYKHIPYHHLPYTCPYTECKWYGKTGYDYTYHQISKPHKMAMLVHPDIPDAIRRNPNGEEIKIEWMMEVPIEENTVLKDITNQVSTNVKRPAEVGDGNITKKPKHHHHRKHETKTKPDIVKDQSKPESCELSLEEKIELLRQKLPVPIPDFVEDISDAESDGQVVSSINEAEPSTSSVKTDDTLPATHHHVASASLGDVAEEMIVTRKDLTHHFLHLEQNLDIKTKSYMDSTNKQVEFLNLIGQRLTSIENMSKVNLVSTSQATPCLRLQLAGVIDHFFKLLAPLHRHQDGILGYSPSCLACQSTEEFLFKAVACTDPRLIEPHYRDSSSFDAAN